MIIARKTEFLKAIRENVKAKAAKKGIRLSKPNLDELTLQQAADAICGTSARVLNKRLNQLLEMV